MGGKRNRKKPMKTNGPKNQPTHKGDGPPPNHPIPWNLEPSPEDHSPRHQRTECRPDQTPISKLVLDSLTFIAAVVVAVIYYNQLVTLVDSNKINRESLQAVQRAFISYHGIVTTRAVSAFGGERYISFQSEYQNDGNTPALNVVNMYVTGEGKSSIPEEIFLKGKPEELPDKFIVTSIGPKGTLQGTSPQLLPESYIFGGNLGDHYENFTKLHPRGDVSIFGWIVYRDVMKEPKLI